MSELHRHRTDSRPAPGRPRTADPRQEDTMTAIDLTDLDIAALPAVPARRRAEAATDRPRPLVTPVPSGLPATARGAGSRSRAATPHGTARDAAGRWSGGAAPSGSLPSEAELTRRARRELAREEHRAVRTLAAVIALACVEVEVGRRHLRDLAAWLDLPVYDKVSRRIALLERTGARVSTAQPPRPLGARVCEVAPGRVEASASIQVGDRVRAIAMRMERRLSRWRVVAVEIG